MSALGTDLVFPPLSANDDFVSKTGSVPGFDLSHLDWLESEAMHIMREVVAETRNPALLFSGGKDSIVMLRLAEKAFRPDRFPFPLLHIDTEHNFAEVIAFRDARDFERIHTDIITQLPGVSRVQSTLALRTVKKTTALPV